MVCPVCINSFTLEHKKNWLRMVEMKQIRSVQSNIPINHNARYRTEMRRATWKNDFKKCYIISILVFILGSTESCRW